MRTVKSVAELTGVSIRTLHHYDALGLLEPSGRTEAGYRLYDHADLERLQEILVWRQLGFSLAEIAELLDDPGHDRGAALRRQRELIGGEIERLQATALALDAALAARNHGTPAKEETMFEGFDPSRYEAEARQRWGDTDAYRESARRTAGYGEAEWAQIRAQAQANVDALAAAMAAGEPADGERARSLAQEHRAHISRWFYPVSPAMHRNLAEMYVADPRFTASYEQVAPGLAAYVRAAILANADSVEALTPGS
ncbi:MAG TPA: MerR family transcriptional regulator [Solirubrobacteraceae bacterium]|nr:MerR family transcriptional regulator [Solirubrobacteraceae bacterium]